MSAKDIHSKGTHAFIGITAAVIGVVLGIGLVAWDGANDKQLTVQAQEAFCPSGDYTCDFKNPPPGKTNCKMNYPCQKVTNGVTCPGTCQKNKCLSIGKCGGEKLEGKPKDMGMPPMVPMLPMPMPKMPMPPEQPKDECTQTPKPAHCPNSGISGLLGSLFGSTTASSTGGVVQSTIKSVADKLSSFLSGETTSSAVVNTNANTTNKPINNPTQAVVTPVITGSNSGQITSSGNTQVSGSQNGSTQTNSQASVTGFNSNASAEQINTSTGPILSAMRLVISRIQSILSSMF